MASLPNAQLTHVGLYVRQLKVMVDFYCRHLGMVVSDSGPFLGRELTFLSRSPNEHHQLVLIFDPARTDNTSPLNQISFRLDDLEALRAYHAYLLEEQAVGLEGRNHGNSWSLYFFDPEGNKIEMYVPTPWAVSQPWRAPLDLTRPAGEIYAATEVVVGENPTVRPMSQWSAEMRVRLAAPQQ